MGTFRLLLAVIVMLGHLSFYPQPIPYFLPGGIAVEAFYIVSGFLITLVLVEKYQDRLLLFYSNRALRIYPIYWTCLLLYLLVNTLCCLWLCLDNIEFAFNERLMVGAKPSDRWSYESSDRIAEHFHRRPGHCSKRFWQPH